MIYLDTSGAPTHLLSEDRQPPADIWSERLIASRLVEYEIWTRIHARGLGRSHGELVMQLLVRLALLELVAPILTRALEPFPAPVRTLDALHLASIEFLRDRGQDIRLASYDTRQLTAARGLGIQAVRLE